MKAIDLTDNEIVAVKVLFFLEEKKKKDRNFKLF
jgi:hypothetical protein